MWQSAALGLLDRVQARFDLDDPPTSDDITSALWCACRGGQQQVAQVLLDNGGDLNWIGYDQLTPLDAARRSGADELAAWLAERGAKTTSELRPASS